VLNGAALALMTSVGHRTGLFDALAGMDPATSDAIARRAGLQERYVREWLGAMWGSETACRMLEPAGFGKVEVKSLPHDATNYYYVASRQA
jgi:hypothetical protein